MLERDDGSTLYSLTRWAVDCADRLATALEARRVGVSAEAKGVSAEQLAAAARNATLPEGYHWGREAMEQFNYGKERAALAILALLNQENPPA